MQTCITDNTLFHFQSERARCCCWLLLSHLSLSFSSTPSINPTSSYPQSASNFNHEQASKCSRLRTPPLVFNALSFVIGSCRVEPSTMTPPLDAVVFSKEIQPRARRFFPHHQHQSWALFVSFRLSICPCTISHVPHANRLDTRSVQPRQIDADVRRTATGMA